MQIVIFSDCLNSSSDHGQLNWKFQPVCFFYSDTGVAPSEERPFEIFRNSLELLVYFSNTVWLVQSYRKYTMHWKLTKNNCSWFSVKLSLQESILVVIYIVALLKYVSIVGVMPPRSKIGGHIVFVLSVILSLSFHLKLLIFQWYHCWNSHHL